MRQDGRALRPLRCDWRRGLLPAMALAAALGGLVATRPASVSAEIPAAARATTIEDLPAPPRLTATISTIVARAGGDVRILAVEAALPAADETRMRIAGGLPMRILGTAASPESLERFVTALREHAFLGPVELTEAPVRANGAFEVRIGDPAEVLFPRSRTVAGEALATGGGR